MIDLNPFLVMACLGALLASIAGGIVGSYVVVKRIVFISGSIAHSVLGGMGLCVYLRRVYDLPWLDPLYGALLTAVLSALAVGTIHLRYKEREDTVIGAIWSIGMALGVIFLSLTPGYNVEVMAFLFGNILWTSRADLIMLLILDGVIILSVLVFHRRFLAICFDETQSTLQGIPVKRLYFLLLLLVALTVVILIQVVGSILVLALLSLPAAVANAFTKRLSHTMILAIGVAMAFSVIGLGASQWLNWPSGATIALISTLGYLFIRLVRRA